MALKLMHIGKLLILIGLLGFVQPPALLATCCPEPPELALHANQRSGAATLDELSAVLFSAIKSNNFGQLSGFFPEQQELALLQKGRNKNLQVITEKLTPEQIKASFKTDFESLMKTSADQVLNWSEMTLTETTPNRLRSPQTTLAPVKMYISAGENQSRHYLLYEAIRIRNRYYLFQHITLEKSS